MRLLKPIIMDFAGSHSTGKTTLIEDTAKLWSAKANYAVNIISSISRTLKEEQNLFLYEKTDGFAQCFITLGNLANILASTEEYDITLCTDLGLRSLGYTLASEKMDKYTEEIHWKWMNIFNSQLLNIDVYRFYLPIEFDMVKDGVRKDDEGYRQIVDDAIRHIIEKSELTVRHIEGTPERRRRLMKDLIDKIHKKKCRIYD